MINELVNRAVDAVEAGLLETPPSRLGFAARAAAENTIPDTDGEGNPLYPEARKEIEEGVHQLETLLEATVDKNFDKLEIYLLRNVLTVPEDLVPWVRINQHLTHFQGLQLPNASTSASTPLPTPESVQALRRKVQETNKLHSALLAERARNDALLKQLRSLLGGNANAAKTEPSSLAFLASASAARSLDISLPTDGSAALPKHEPLRQNTAFALSQLPALRQILQNLRPRIAGLGAPGGAGPGSEFARQRSEYVEKQTRRIMERRGMDVGNGEGGSEGLGRRMLPEEVRGMEAVAGLVGEKKGGESGNDERMEE
ncbi:Kinetochore-associated protein MTW1 [Diplodia seriata]|uniref:Kinetochore-associated protein MTW1 n=1 Tax=Diplodia seriata TaxID=420778 RepID=A0A1S8B656_9PEZI|nr:Kinetochore-associated protein MTW1 [Diplodia seriata]